MDKNTENDDRVFRCNQIGPYDDRTTPLWFELLAGALLFFVAWIGACLIEMMARGY